MKIRFFNPGLGYEKIKDEVLPEIDRILSNGDLILREDVERFEQTLAGYLGVKYVVALNSCTDALYLSLKALGIGRGDAVIVPSRTFVATAQVVNQVGATLIQADLDGKFELPDGITIEDIKAVIPVHIEGAIADNFGDILKTAKQNGWYVIEDAAQALGANYNGRMAGSIGDTGCFSFYPAKILGAYGDAGALVTNNKKIYEWVKGARNHFKETAEDWGVNSRMDNIQAVVLNTKIKYLDQTLKIRKNIADMYREGISGRLELPENKEGRVWQDYIVRTDQRDQLYNFLKDNGIETMKNNYPFPVPKMPQAQKYEDETLRLPCNELLTDEEVLYIISKVNEFFQ